MYRISGMNFHYQRFPFEYFLDSLVNLGVEYVELWAGEPHLYVEDAPVSQVSRMRHEIAVRGLKTVCFTPEQCIYPVNIAAKNDRYRSRSVQYFIKCVELAAEFGAKTLLVTTGRGYYDEDKAEPWKRAVESIRAIAEAACKYDITVAIETMTRYATNIANNMADLVKLIKDIDMTNVKPMLDTVPMHMAGETVEQYVEAFGENLAHIHFLDGDGVSGSHLALGDGVYPLEEYIGSLKKYHGYLTPEICIARYYLEPEKAMKQCINRLKQGK